MHHPFAASAPTPVITEPDLWIGLFTGIAVLLDVCVLSTIPPLLRQRRRTGGPVHSSPIKATSYDAEVIIRVDAAGARDIADAVEFAYASGFLVDETRPTYLAEVAMIRRAAAYADEQAGIPLPEPVRVPLLRVVGGELA